MRVDERTRDGLAAAAAALLVLCAYHGALRVPFVWDDHRLIAGHALRLELADVPGLFTRTYWSVLGDDTPHHFYRPMVIASLVVDGALWDGAPSGFHLTNVLAHLVVCGLVFALARRAGARREWAFVAALLFGLHPRLTESVTWISGRTDVLASLFGLGALYVHVEPRTPASPARRALAALLLLLALLCKEVAVAVLVAMAAYEWPRQRDAGGGSVRVGAALQAMLPALLATALYLVMRGAAQTTSPVVADISAVERSLRALRALGAYVEMAARPFAPSLFVGPVVGRSPRWLLLGAVALVALGPGLLAAWRASRRVPLLPALIALVLVPLALVLHVVPISLQAIASDRFLYLPVAAAAMGLALLVPDRRTPVLRAGYAGLLLLALAMGLGVHARNVVWQEEVRLWRVTRAGAEDPQGVVENEYAAALSRAGRSQEALAAHRRAYALQQSWVERHPGHPIDPLVGTNLALALSEHGLFEEARPLLEAALARTPDHPTVLLDYGVTLSRALEFERAHVALARAAASAAPGDLVHLLIRQNARAASIWRALPPPSPEEPAALKARRAQVHHLVGRVGLADELMVEALRAPDATPEVLRIAEEMLEQQRRVFADSPHTRALEAALREHAARAAGAARLEG